MQELERLVKRAADGDEKAFEELYKQTYKQVYFTCNAFLKNEQDAADAMQDIYLIVLHSVDTLKDVSKFESWLGRITINKCKDYLKKNKPVLMEEETLAEMLVEDDELVLPEEYAMNKAKRKILMDILEKNLSDVLFQTVLLFYFHDMSAVEIADWMECPVGTVTSRLCLARTKIKEAILDYEKKSGDKLHGMVLVPILALLFQEEANAMEPEVVCNEIIKAFSTGKNAASATKKGGKAMLKSLKGKMIMGVMGLLAVGGCITVVVSQNKELESSESSSEMVVESIIESDEAPITHTEEAEVVQSHITQEVEMVESKEPEEEVIYDYEAMAQSVATQIDEYFLALTTGDVQTLIQMTVPNEGSKYYEQFLEISQFECTPQFLRTMFGDVKYCIDEATISSLADDLEDAIEYGDEYIRVNMKYSEPLFFLMNCIYPAAFPDGTEIAQRRNINNNEDAFVELERTLSVVPMTTGDVLCIKVPDEKGEIKVAIETIINGLELDEVSDLTEHYPAEYVNEHLEMIDDIKVGNLGNGFYKHNEVVAEIDKYLTQKDFKALEVYLSNLNGEDYATKYGEKYGTYEALNDTQKQFVDQFIAEKFDYQMIEFTFNDTDGKLYGYSSGMMLLTFPRLDDLENRDIMLTDWYEENNVMEHTIAFPASSSYTEYSEFIFRYYNVIEYATKYVE